ncbi:glucoamylase family protein [Rudaeicoccus suwonensis]|uniref:Uncharacterized protein DUF3131 n=1 Tax=Rudaeicoccus suwonensis TaxID=657409 RepID=A0A561E804_9MICO|nr:glucoamylase family protein [Rudaeicoccus suwonensis]TWE11726.1 uncharacterized protein DUF3131 [Rudaeicoccus suwonensis]
MHMTHRRRLLAIASASTAALTAVATATPALAQQPGRRDGVANFNGLSNSQKAQLRSIARDTWKFMQTDVDPKTHLPMDNLTYAGGAKAPTSYGRYTSAANIGVYLWSVVSAADLKLVSRKQATKMVSQTLTEVSHLDRYKGFLYQWYSTTTGAKIRNPNDINCSADTSPQWDNCSFVSNVDNGWYASGLIVARNAMPQLRGQIDALMKPMDFGIFYDDRAQSNCDVNSAIAGDQPTGQMFGGYYVGSSPYVGTNWQHYYHNGALYSDPRISAYIGMGLKQMPGDVWWKTWRTLPPKAPGAACQASDPDFSWQGQWPVAGSWVKQRDPISGKTFTVWEGHYTYPGTNLKFLPTYSGGMFEAMMANIVVPETSWGPKSFGLADARTVEVQRKYATQELGLPVWGMSPSSTADDSGGYGGYGVEGLKFPYHGAGATAADPNLGLSQCHTCATEDVVTPHASFISLDVAPQAAMANINTLLKLYPGIYGVGGFFDAVNPTTGAIGHRYLVLDQSMILASIDNAVNNRSIQRYFAADKTSWAAREDLGVENLGL